jgi:hypothetical protein
MGTFTETAIVDHRLSFADQVKQAFIFCSVCSKHTVVGNLFSVCIIPETWRHGDIELWRHGDEDIETWRHRHGDQDMETWRNEDMETRRYGDMETWRQGDMDVEF